LILLLLSSIKKFRKIILIFIF